MKLLGSNLLEPAKTLPFDGKFLRADFCFAVGRKHNVDENFLLKSSAIIELFHLASIIHDDVIDNTKIRRGNLSENIKSGNKSAVLVGDYIMTSAFSEMEKRFDSETKNFVYRTIKTMVLKELEQNTRKNDYEMNLEEYYSIASGKTGSLFGLAGFLGCNSNNCSEKTRLRIFELGKFLGILYQCVDDIIDLREDISNEIMTFPIILTLEKYPDLRQKNKQFNKNYKLINLLEKQESFDFVINKVTKIFAEIEAECLSLDLQDFKILSYIKEKLKKFRFKTTP
jgi:heptaprenyl diphosphate synthase